jgi:hypothetical protein
MPDLPPIEAEPPIAEDDGQPINIFVEPPITEEDTRQRRAVTPTSTDEHAGVPADIEGEPEFLERMVDLSRFEPPREPTDTQPGKPVEAPAATTAPAPESPAPAKPVGAETSSSGISPRGEEAEPPAYPPTRSTVPDYRTMRPEPTREPEPEPSILATPVVKYRDLIGKELPPSAPPKPEEAATTAPAAQASEPPVPSPDHNYAVEKPTRTPEPPAPRSESTAAPTETKSIWEVFGVPRPSETGEATAAAPEPTPAPEAATPAEPITPAAAAASVVAAAPEPAAMPDTLSFPPASTRTGLRLALRRRMVSVRRP